uniref:Protein kinase domain-containing protein n=1 Tax=Macrostomum lignano TaxID=282301 RepID=A0A1I8FQ03_9PLAT
TGQTRRRASNCYSTSLSTDKFRQVPPIIWLSPGLHFVLMRKPMLAAAAPAASGDDGARRRRRPSSPRAALGNLRGAAARMKHAAGLAIYLEELRNSEAGAAMLVESMAERELFLALRIIGGLHSHVVQVMEPRYGRLCERSDHLAELEVRRPGSKPRLRCRGCRSHFILASAPSVASARRPPKCRDSAGSAAAQATARCRPSAKTIMRRAYKALKGNGPHLFDFSLPFSSEHNQRVATRVTAKAKEMAQGKGWPEDIWLKLPYGSRLVYAAVPGFSAKDEGLSIDAFFANMFLASNLPRAAQRVQSESDSLHLMEPVCGAKHRQIGCRDTGRPDRHINDFRKKMRTRFRMDICAAKARLLAIFDFKKKRRFKSRSDSCLASPELAEAEPPSEKFRTRGHQPDLDELEKFAEYTSSDEECGSGGADQLRVRELSWESDEVKRLKRQLDQVYADNCATTKQKQQLARCIRDPVRSRSQRPPPEAAAKLGFEGARCRRTGRETAPPRRLRHRLTAFAISVIRPASAQSQFASADQYSNAEQRVVELLLKAALCPSCLRLHGSDGEQEAEQKQQDAISSGAGGKPTLPSIRQRPLPSASVSMRRTSWQLRRWRQSGYLLRRYGGEPVAYGTGAAATPRGSSGCGHFQRPGSPQNAQASVTP